MPKPQLFQIYTAVFVVCHFSGRASENLKDQINWFGKLYSCGTFVLLVSLQPTIKINTSPNPLLEVWLWFQVSNTWIQKKGVFDTPFFEDFFDKKIKTHVINAKSIKIETSPNPLLDVWLWFQVSNTWIQKKKVCLIHLFCEDFFDKKSKHMCLTQSPLKLKHHQTDCWMFGCGFRFSNTWIEKKACLIHLFFWKIFPKKKSKQKCLTQSQRWEVIS